MIKEQLDSLPKSALFICKRCRTLYWNLLSRGQLDFKNNSVICPICNRTNIYSYNSKEELVMEIIQTISALGRTKRKEYEKNIFDLNNLKNQLVNSTINRELTK